MKHRLSLGVKGKITPARAPAEKLCSSHHFQKKLKHFGIYHPERAATFPTGWRCCPKTTQHSWRWSWPKFRGTPHPYLHPLFSKSISVALTYCRSQSPYQQTRAKVVYGVIWLGSSVLLWVQHYGQVFHCIDISDEVLTTEMRCNGSKPYRGHIKRQHSGKKQRESRLESVIAKHYNEGPQCGGN